LTIEYLLLKIISSSLGVENGFGLGAGWWIVGGDSRLETMAGKLL